METPVKENPNEKLYSIPIIWESYMRVDVTAANLQEAVDKAVNKFLSIPDPNYLEDSFNIDPIIEEENHGEEYDVSKLWK